MKSYWNLNAEQQAQVDSDPKLLAAYATFATTEGARAAAYAAVKALYAARRSLAAAALDDSTTAALYASYDTYDAILDEYDTALNAAIEVATIASNEAMARTLGKGN